jgi:hypothetical protein
MGLDGRQIFVWEGSIDRVSGLISRYVDKVGSAACVYVDSEKATPDMAGRTQREFTVSGPRNEDLVETDAEVEALKQQRAEIAKFPKLTIPCK